MTEQIESDTGINKDELALILKPVYKDGEDWDGTFMTGVRALSDNEVPDNVLMVLFDTATLMAAFIDACEVYPELHQLVILHREKMLGETLEESDGELTMFSETWGTA